MQDPSTYTKGMAAHPPKHHVAMSHFERLPFGRSSTSWLKLTGFFPKENRAPENGFESNTVLIVADGLQKKPED